MTIFVTTAEVWPVLVGIERKASYSASLHKALMTVSGRTDRLKGRQYWGTRFGGFLFALFSGSRMAAYSRFRLLGKLACGTWTRMSGNDPKATLGQKQEFGIVKIAP